MLAGSQLGSGGTGGGSGGSGQGGVLSGLQRPACRAPPIPNLDPTFFINGQFVHNTTIQTATNITGTNFLVTAVQIVQLRIQQGFLTGTSLQLGMGNTVRRTRRTRRSTCSTRTTSRASRSRSSRTCCRASGRRSTTAHIRVAKNQLHISDLTFKNQVMATVSNVVNLYWDLVSVHREPQGQAADARSEHQAVQRQQAPRRPRRHRPHRYHPGRSRDEGRQQDVTTAETQVLQQETILKIVLTRSGLDHLEIANAHIVPTDHFDVPAQEAVRPIQDLIAEAMPNRPDVEQSQIGLEDARITTLGVKDAMLPQLTAFATTSNSGLAGQVNTLPVPVTCQRPVRSS